MMGAFLSALLMVNTEKPLMTLVHFSGDIPSLLIEFTHGSAKNERFYVAISLRQSTVYN